MTNFFEPTLLAFFAAAFLAACSDSGQEPQSAMPGEVHVYVAKKIITMEPAMPEAKVVAIRDGRILGVGRTLKDLEPWFLGQPHVIDRGFSDKILMPGLIDPHLHPIMGAVLLPTEFITPEDWDLPGGYVTGLRTQELTARGLPKRWLTTRAQWTNSSSHGLSPALARGSHPR